MHPSYDYDKSAPAEDERKKPQEREDSVEGKQPMNRQRRRYLARLARKRGKAND